MSIHAITVLPYMLRDARSAPDHDKILYTIPVSVKYNMNLSVFTSVTVTGLPFSS